MLRGATGIGGALLLRMSRGGRSLERGRSGELLLLSRDGIRSVGYGRRSEVSVGNRWSLSGGTAAAVLAYGSTGEEFA